ncbi:hypothetical protein AHAS_Ahas04G0150700 [Arachis hypogaea]
MDVGVGGTSKTEKDQNDRKRYGDDTDEGRRSKMQRNEPPNSPLRYNKLRTTTSPAKPPSTPPPLPPPPSVNVTTNSVIVPYAGPTTQNRNMPQKHHEDWLSDLFATTSRAIKVDYGMKDGVYNLSIRNVSASDEAEREKLLTQSGAMLLLQGEALSSLGQQLSSLFQKSLQSTLANFPLVPIEKPQDNIVSHQDLK